MKNQWMIWVLVVGVIAVVLFTFNYQSGKDTLPLGEIFPEEQKTAEPNIEYEFVQSGQPETARETAALPQGLPAAALSGSTTRKPAPAVKAADIERPDLAQVPFTIQILSSQNKTGAEAALQKAKESGFPAYLATKDLGDKGLWHRIYVGTFQNKDEADQYLPKVKQKYPDSFILRPQ